MKRTLGIAVGLALVLVVIGITLLRDAAPSATDARHAVVEPAAITQEERAVSTARPGDARATARQGDDGADVHTRSDTVAAPAVPDAPAGARPRGLVLDPSEPSRSAPSGQASIDKEGIQAAIRAVKPQIAECYEKALAHDPDLSGSLVVEFTIEAVDGGGSVTAGEINTSDMQAPFFEACVLKQVAHTPFPLPSGGGVVKVKYPFHFDQGEHAD